jgi:hypothetical protein
MTKPTVTQILKLIDKPALVKWANKLGLEGTSLDSFYEKKREEGISLHAQIERYAKSGVRMKDPAHQERIEKFFQTRRVVATEREIETEWFTGRTDVVFYQDDDQYVGDFKSSDGLYFENKLQLAAYQLAYPKAKICVIHIPLFVVETIKEDLRPYQDIVKLLSKVWQIKEGIIK